MDPDAERISRSGSSVEGEATTRTPWLLVVARGHARLVAELRALFREYPLVQVIEDRRHGRALLPRYQNFLRPTG